MSLASGPGRGGGESSMSNKTSTLPSLDLAVAKHLEYVKSLDVRKNELEYHLTEHLRMNGIYWGLTACHLLAEPTTLPRQSVIEFTLSCLHPNGGFGAAPGHDAHMLYTVSAIQTLAMLDALDELDTATALGSTNGRLKTGKFIAGLQDPATGGFFGDEWGEADTRFLYGALNALSLLGLMYLVNTDLCLAHVRACANFDGGYGLVPGAESHAGQVFTCVGALSILQRLDLVDRDKLGAWLSERQLPSGGLNGRPEKLEDVCYSWWVLSSLAMIDRLHWIDREKMINFILSCQDPQHGGFADRPGDMVDVYHTVFAIAGLSLLQHPSVQPVDARYCLPVEVTQRVLSAYSVSNRTSFNTPRIRFDSQSTPGGSRH